jgi:hypothetical protein
VCAATVPCPSILSPYIASLVNPVAKD